jgi:hypothetical protein
MLFNPEKMKTGEDNTKKMLVASLTIVCAAIIVGAFILMNCLDTLNALKHETNRWAVIEDVNCDRIAIEPTRDNVWLQLVQLQQNESRMWIGSIVESYDNKWGFRFKPENITIAQFTAEGLQATIRFINENVTYWVGGWSYVSGRVVETHSS